MTDRIPESDAPTHRLTIGSPRYGSSRVGDTAVDTVWLQPSYDGEPLGELEVTFKVRRRFDGGVEIDLLFRGAKFAVIGATS